MVKIDAITQAPTAPAGTGTFSKVMLIDGNPRIPRREGSKNTEGKMARHMRDPVRVLGQQTNPGNPNCDVPIDPFPKFVEADTTNGVGFFEKDMNDKFKKGEYVGEEAQQWPSQGIMDKSQPLNTDNVHKHEDTIQNVPNSAGKQPIQSTQRSFADIVGTVVTNEPVNFRYLEGETTMEGADVVIPVNVVRKASEKFQNTLYGYFLGKRLPFPIVEKYVNNAWAKYGLTRVMMNGKGFFFFKFGTKEGMERLLEGGPAIIRSVPLILNVWSPSVDMKKEGITSVPVWVKLHDVPVTAYSEDGLSMIATKLGNPKRVDAYTAKMCKDAWGRSNYARALIEINAEKELKDNLTVAVSTLKGDGVLKVNVSVEYE